MDKKVKWQKEGRVPTVGENEQEMAKLREQIAMMKARQCGGIVRRHYPNAPRLK